MTIQDDRTPTLTRRVQIARLLFGGAAFGTDIVLVSAAASPKLPPFVGE